MPIHEPTSEELIREGRYRGDQDRELAWLLRLLAARLESAREAMELARDAFDGENHYQFQRDAIKRLDEELAK